MQTEAAGYDGLRFCMKKAPSQGALSIWFYSFSSEVQCAHLVAAIGISLRQ